MDIKIVDIGDNKLLQLDDYYCIITGFNKINDKFNIEVNVCGNMDDLNDFGEDLYFESSIKPSTISIVDFQQLQLDKNIVVYIYKTIEGQYLVGEETERVSNMYVEHKYKVISTYDKLIEYVKKQYNRKAVKLLTIS